MDRLLVPENPQPNEKKPIDRWAKSARCAGAFGCAIMAYDSDDKELIGIICKPKSISNWMMQGVTNTDRTRLAQALQGLTYKSIRTK